MEATKVLSIFHIEMCPAAYTMIKTCQSPIILLFTLEHTGGLFV